MATENIDDLVKRVVGEILEENQDLTANQPFNIVVYDARWLRIHGIFITHNSLPQAVRDLYKNLQLEPKYEGEILLYKPKLRVVYKKSPNQ